MKKNLENLFLYHLRWVIIITSKCFNTYIFTSWCWLSSRNCVETYYKFFVSHLLQPDCWSLAAFVSRWVSNGGQFSALIKASTVSAPTCLHQSDFIPVSTLNPRSHSSLQHVHVPPIDHVHNSLMLLAVVRTCTVVQWSTCPVRINSLYTDILYVLWMARVMYSLRTQLFFFSPQCRWRNQMPDAFACQKIHVWV